MAAVWKVTSLRGEPVSYWGYVTDSAEQLAFATVGKCQGGWMLSIHDGRSRQRSLSRLCESAEYGMRLAERWARPRRQALAARRSRPLRTA